MFIHNASKITPIYLAIVWDDRINFMALHLEDTEYD